MTYSNPCLVAQFSDWPIGNGLRGECVFKVETHPTRGVRVSRRTRNNHGLWCKPKYSTYQGPSAIVTGENDRTYILQEIPQYDAVRVSRHDFLDSTEGTVYKGTNPARYDELKSLIASAK